MKARYVAFSARVRQYRHLAKKVNRLLKDGTFHLLSDFKKKKMLHKLQQRLKNIGHLFPQPRLRETFAGIALLLGTAAANPLDAQSFAPPVTAPFGLDENATFGFMATTDIDSDGDTDLFLWGYTSGSYNQSFLFYENTGTPEIPAFDNGAPVSNPFGFQSPGNITTPIFADIDNDGDKDLFLGTYYGGGINFLENTGTPDAPAFAAPVSNPFGLTGGTDFDVPVFVDLDNDGDLDLVSSQYYSDFLVFENTGTPEAPAFAAPSLNAFGLTPALPTSYVTFHTFSDLDNDGDIDMLQFAFDYYAGTQIYYQQNDGTPEVPDFGTPVLAPFGLDAASFLIGVPAMADIDNDGDEDLFVSADNYFEQSIYFIENTTIDISYPPTAADNTVTTEEDEAYLFQPGDFNFMDGDLSDQLSEVEITTLPTKGDLLLNGAAVTLNQAIPAADLPNLYFEPAANENGVPYDSFSFRVSDGAEWSTDEFTLTINVTPVNDFPVSTDAGVLGTQDIAYTFAQDDFPFDDIDGDNLTGVSIVSLPAKGKLQFNGAAATANQLIPVGEIGQLTFTPDAGEFGTPYTEFQFKVSDGTLFSTNANTLVINIQEASASKDRTLNATVTLSPNPASDLVLLKVESARPLGQPTAIISNAAGLVVRTVDLPQNTAAFNHAIDISPLAPGLYFLKIQSGDQWQTVRFVKA